MTSTVKLTAAQRRVLEHAAEQGTVYPERRQLGSRAGGAIHRMVERLAAAGLLEKRAPHAITDAGRAAAAKAAAAQSTTAAKESAVDLENVTIDKVNANRDRMCASFNYGGARYFIWFNPHSMFFQDTLHKQVPLPRRGSLGLPRHRHSYCNPSARQNKPIMAALLAEIRDRKLVEQALAEEDRKQAVWQAEQDRQRADERLREAAPDLLDQLKKLTQAYVGLLETGRDRIVSLGGDCDPVDRMERDDPNLRAARAAIAKATGGDR